ncbi:MAG: DUF1499 domain-containing protein [Pseudomonadota bacterium]
MVTINERLARIQRPRSTAGEWSYKFAVFAIPYFVLVILGHRFGFVDTLSMFWMLALGFALLVMAILLAGKGFYDLWTEGQKAGINSAKAMVLAGLMLLPFFYYGAQALLLPPLFDISTDLEDIPAYDSVLELRTDGMNPLEEPSQAARDLQLTSYPKVAARRYPLGEGRVFREIVALITDRDWTILTANTEQGNAPIDSEGSGLVARPRAGENGVPINPSIPKRRPTFLNTPQELAGGFETVQVSPVGRDEDTGEQQERYVEAIAESLIMGFPSDVVIRIIEEEDGTLVDMRSSSRWGPHDLGANAAIVINFMQDLDLALQGLGQSE